MNAPAPRAALYYRTSVESEDPERQLDELHKLAGTRAWVVVAELGDRAVSGAAEERPALENVLELARSHAIDVVGVVELSRISRAGILDLFLVMRQLDQAKVELVSIAEPWVTTAGPFKEPLLAFVAWAAASERRLLVERTKSGLERARLLGRPIGRPRVLTDEKVERIRDLRYAQGKPWKEVAQHVGIHATTCRKVKPAPPPTRPPVLNNQNAPEGPGTLPPLSQGDDSERLPPDSGVAGDPDRSGIGSTKAIFQRPQAAKTEGPADYSV